jgi:hypothetical protein
VDDFEAAEDSGEAAMAELDKLRDVSRDGEGEQGGNDLLHELDLGAVPGGG